MDHGTLKLWKPNNFTKPYIIDTASGEKVDLDDPQPENIRIEDVAGGLSKVCRFGAQAREYYSVAQHALLVHDVSSSRPDTPSLGW